MRGLWGKGLGEGWRRRYGGRGVKGGVTWPGKSYDAACIKNTSVAVPTSSSLSPHKLLMKSSTLAPNA